MENTALLASVIFVIAYIVIVSEKIHRTVVALSGGVVMLLAGIITQEQAIRHIDFNTIGLLVGMMLIVNITSGTGLFNYLAVWSAKKVKAEPLRLLLVLSVITAVCSAFLDNVTTVLLTVPITFSITSQLQVKATPFLTAQILASNIGGTATLIGDPPNIMIGSAVKELDFMSFISNLGLVCVVILVITLALLAFLYRKQMVTTDALKASVMGMDEKAEIKDATLLKKCLAVLAITITLFAFHGALHLESATAALAGASLLMLITASHDQHMLERIFGKIEWLAIFFFAGLFTLVGGLVETGVISLLAQKAMEVTAGDLTATAFLTLWMSAVASAFVDNIPFVATMIPLIKEMSKMGMTNLEPIWWSLSLGACLGGNGTLIGASANVVVAGIAAQRGNPLSFTRFMFVAFPLMIVSIVIANAYIYWFYL